MTATLPREPGKARKRRPSGSVEDRARKDEVVAHVEGHAGGAVGLAVHEMVPALLDGGEVVHFAIKPSAWFILLVSLKWIALGTALFFFAGSEWAPAKSRWYLSQLGVLLVAVRLAWAILEWVSRLYVLTNRRVMRIRGIFQAELFECRLERIANIHLSIPVTQQATRTGTIGFQTSTDGASWRVVSRPNEVYAKLREAVGRAKNRGNHESL